MFDKNENIVHGINLISGIYLQQNTCKNAYKSQLKSIIKGGRKMILQLNELRDKLAGCWTGKNVGGVLGAPFECKRMIPNVDFYVQDLTQGPPANDDLDLQIVWLAAVERYGRNVNASILGEYWLSFVIPNWVEYGTGKTNLRAGLVPPLSGDVDNTYKNSNGCWIRSELWACLAPGHPEIATRYAFEDAIVDHADEGMYAEIFTSAIQSAAFVENDREKLVEIGLSYLPENCITAQTIRKAVDCYHSGVDFIEARKLIHNAAPGTFGIQGIAISEIPTENNEGMELGAAGFDAPENVAFVVLGLLYGEGDFGKSLILANNCGEDTDCTCATLGALLGIINGASKLPKKWTDPLNDKIVTMCINKTGGGIWVPETATQLAERILRDIPGFLGQDLCDVFAEGGMKIECCEKEALFCKKIDDYLPYINLSGRMYETPLNELCAQPYVARYQFTAFQVLIDYEGSAFFKKGENRKFKVKVINSNAMREQQWVKIKLYLPDGVTAVGVSEVEMPLNNLYLSCAEKEFELNTESFMSGRLELIVDVSLNGRHSSGPVKMVLLGQ